MERSLVVTVVDDRLIVQVFEGNAGSNVTDGNAHQLIIDHFDAWPIVLSIISEGDRLSRDRVRIFIRQE